VACIGRLVPQLHRLHQEYAAAVTAAEGVLQRLVRRNEASLQQTLNELAAEVTAARSAKAEANAYYARKHEEGDAYHARRVREGDGAYADKMAAAERKLASLASALKG